jgi:hypothetical protein
MAYVRGGSTTSRPAGTAGGAGTGGTQDRGTSSPLGGIWSPAQRQAAAAVVDDDGGVDWDRVGIFGAGIALGALLGVGITLFTAPVSGPDARLAVRRRARHALWSGKDAWEDLRDELAAATMRKKKELRRRRRRVREVWSDGTLD